MRVTDYNKPIASGGKSRCAKCGVPKKRVTPPKDATGRNRFPRTDRSGCLNGSEHQYETEPVSHGWSTRDG